jgi:hypothetical protein
MNSFYEDDIENELQQNIHDVKEPNKNRYINAVLKNKC